MKKQLCALLSCILSSLTLSAADAPQKEVPPFLYKIVRKDAVKNIDRLPKAHSFWYPYDNENPFHTALKGLCFIGADTRERALTNRQGIIEHNLYKTTVLTESQYKDYVANMPAEKCHKIRIIQIKTEFLHGELTVEPLASDPAQSFFHYRDNNAPGTVPIRALMCAFKATNDGIPQEIEQLLGDRPHADFPVEPNEPTAICSWMRSESPTPQEKRMLRQRAEARLKDFLKKNENL